jgi:hypothetical protein
MRITEYFWPWDDLRLIIILSLVLLLFGAIASASESEDVQHYKMLSAIEYTGKGQFSNQSETFFTVTKEPLAGSSVKYIISTDNAASEQGTEAGSISFVVDKKNGRISETGADLSLLERVNNHCIRFLKQRVEKNIGKTWKQTFTLSSVDAKLPRTLKLTMTAIGLETKLFGNMVAVRGLSEPFSFEVGKEGAHKGLVKGRINAMYLFDKDIENVYISVAVFEAETNINGFDEKLRHEIATYKTDAAGQSVDLSGLGQEFEKLVGKVGLATRNVKIEKESRLPQWIQNEGLYVAQVSNMCAAMACESAVNPVAAMYLPAARVIAQHSLGTLPAAVAPAGTIGSLLTQSVPGIGGMKIAIAPAFLGVGVGTAGAVAGGAVGTVAVAGGFDSSNDNRSPSN